MDYGKEFRNYAVNHMNIPGTTVDAVTDYQVDASMTPYILEERKMNVTQMDIFSRLMLDRILWVAGPVNDRMSNTIMAQLLFLENQDKERDITMYVNSPGGSVSSGLSMVATMDYIRPDISTVNVGMCASMGSVLLGAGTKGKRFSTKFSRVMLHQISSGMQSNIQDMRISMEEAEKYNVILFDLLGEYTGKTAKQVLEDTNRDKWLNPQESLDYGIIDGIVERK